MHSVFQSNCRRKLAGNFKAYFHYLFIVMGTIVTKK